MHEETNLTIHLRLMDESVHLNQAQTGSSVFARRTDYLCQSEEESAVMKPIGTHCNKLCVLVCHVIPLELVSSEGSNLYCVIKI